MLPSEDEIATVKVKDAMAVLNEHNGILLASDGCLCCDGNPICTMRLISLKFMDHDCIGFFLCRPCLEGGYSLDKVLENILKLTEG